MGWSTWGPRGLYVWEGLVYNEVDTFIFGEFMRLKGVLKGTPFGHH